MAKIQKLSDEIFNSAKQNSSFISKYKKVEGSECILDEFTIPENTTYGLQAAIQKGDQLFYFSKKTTDVEDFTEADELILTMFEAICDITNNDGVITLKKGERKLFITGVYDED